MASVPPSTPPGIGIMAATKPDRLVDTTSSVSATGTDTISYRVSALLPSRESRSRSTSSWSSPSSSPSPFSSPSSSSCSPRPKRSSIHRLFSPPFSLTAPFQSASCSTPSAIPSSPFHPRPPSATCSLTSRTSTATRASSLSNRSLATHHACWPATLDRECDKAASILKSFCVDGCLAPSDRLSDTPLDHRPLRSFSQSITSPHVSAAHDVTTHCLDLVLQRIPPRVIQDAAGLVVFNCMRSGLWMTGSGGSGILIARHADGTWSPPSAVLLHTPTLSFVIGVDVYDCVLVVNNFVALDILAHLPHVTLGDHVSVTTGPLVPISSFPKTADCFASSPAKLATAVSLSPSDSVYAYLKARGQFRPANLNGCILSQRLNENERFYAHPVAAADVLAGSLPNSVAVSAAETAPLLAVIRAAEGRTDYDPITVAQVPANLALVDTSTNPAHSDTASPSLFGTPDLNDPDPFGVLALEMAGLEIREAGSRSFSHSCSGNVPLDVLLPSPTSPLFPTFSSASRRSIDTMLSRSNRDSCRSSLTTRSLLADANHSTDYASCSPSSAGLLTPATVDGGCVDRLSLDNLTSLREEDEHELICSPYGNANDENVEDDEDLVILEVATAAKPVRVSGTKSVAPGAIHAKGSLVTIRRQPPPLPLRSPARDIFSLDSSTFTRGFGTDSEPHTPDLTAASSESSSIRTVETETALTNLDRPQLALPLNLNNDQVAVSDEVKHPSSVYHGTCDEMWSFGAPGPCFSHHTSVQEVLVVGELLGDEKLGVVEAGCEAGC